MGAYGKMGNRRSVCLYIDRGVLETAREMGLNLSRVSENALREAVGRLGGPETVLNVRRDYRAGAGIRTRAPGSTGL